MKKLHIVLLSIAGAVLLLVVGGGTFFYFKVYKPIGAPMMAMVGTKALEDQRLQNRTEFLPPASGELSADQVANFIAVEEAVEKQWATAAAVLAGKQSALERTSEGNTLTILETLPVFGSIRDPYLKAKMAQIDAMNRAHLSKKEFEWVRKQLYRAAGLPLAQLDMSDLFAGVKDPVVAVRRFEAREGVPAQNEQLARPLAEKLRAWTPLGFFSL